MVPDPAPRDPLSLSSVSLNQSCLGSPLERAFPRPAVCVRPPARPPVRTVSVLTRRLLQGPTRFVRVISKSTNCSPQMSFDPGRQRLVLCREQTPKLSRLHQRIHTHSLSLTHSHTHTHTRARDPSSERGWRRTLVTGTRRPSGAGT